MKFRYMLAAGVLVCSSAVMGAITQDTTTFGILKLNDTTTTNLIISVPWVDCEGGNVYVSNVVKTTGLTNHDYLILTKREETTTHYYSWILEGGVWKSMVLTSTDLAETGLPSTSASNERIGRGNALMLHRKNPSSPVYLFGRYDASGSATATLGSSSSGVVTTLIAPPGTEGTSFDLTNLYSKFTSGKPETGDTVVFRSKTYSYNTNAKYPDTWTKKEKKTSDSSGLGFAQVKPVNVGDVVIEPGEGFWYQRAIGKGTATITW